MRSLAPALLALLMAAAGSAAVAQSTTAPAASGGPIRPLVPAPEPTEAEAIEQLIKERRLDAALQRAERHLAANPRNAQVRFQRAVILADVGRTADAMSAFEALTQDYPELPEPYNNLAVLHAAAGRYELARSLLQRSLDVQPNYVTAYENLGDLYLSMAADAYDRGLKLAPSNSSLQGKLTLAREAGTKLRSIR